MLKLKSKGVDKTRVKTIIEDCSKGNVDPFHCGGDCTFPITEDIVGEYVCEHRVFVAKTKEGKLIDSIPAILLRSDQNNTIVRPKYDRNTNLTLIFDKSYVFANKKFPTIEGEHYKEVTQK